MKPVFSDPAWNDYFYWQTQDRELVERINRLVQDVIREPLSGVLKPDPLEHALSGWWSRRNTDEHRRVCRVEGDALLLAQLRGHYGWGARS